MELKLSKVAWGLGGHGAGSMSVIAVFVNHSVARMKHVVWPRPCGKTSPMPDKDEKARRKRSDSEKAIISVAVIMSVCVALVLLINGVESCGARRDEERFKRMSDADHVKAGG